LVVATAYRVEGDGPPRHVRAPGVVVAVRPDPVDPRLVGAGVQALVAGDEHLGRARLCDVADRRPGDQLGVVDVVRGPGAREIRGRKLDLHRPPGNRLAVRLPGVFEAVERGHQDVELAVALEVGED